MVTEDKSEPMENLKERKAQKENLVEQEISANTKDKTPPINTDQTNHTFSVM